MESLVTDVRYTVLLHVSLLLLNVQKVRTTFIELFVEWLYLCQWCTGVNNVSHEHGLEHGCHLCVSEFININCISAHITTTSVFY